MSEEKGELDLASTYALMHDLAISIRSMFYCLDDKRVTCTLTEKDIYEAKLSSNTQYKMALQLLNDSGIQKLDDRSSDEVQKIYGAFYAADQFNGAINYLANPGE
jgi:hypothetical protein